MTDKTKEKLEMFFDELLSDIDNCSNIFRLSEYYHLAWGYTNALADNDLTTDEDEANIISPMLYKLYTEVQKKKDVLKL